jgi:hypothetical protein
VGRQRHAPATLPPAIDAVVVPCNCPRSRQYSYQFAVPPYYIRYGLKTASIHPHNHLAEASDYVYSAVTVNITALWDMTPCNLVESYFSFSSSPYSWYRCACTTVQDLATQQTAVLTHCWVLLITKWKSACVFISFVRSRQLHRVESPHPLVRPVNSHRDQGSDKRDAVYIPLMLNLPYCFRARTRRCYEH